MSEQNSNNPETQELEHGVKITPIRLTGMILGGIALTMAWILYGFWLSVIIFVAIFANNLEQVDRLK